MDENKTDIKQNRRTTLLAGIALVLLLAAGWMYKVYVDKNQSANDTTQTTSDQATPGDNTGTDNTAASPTIDALNEQIKSNPTDPNLYAEKSNILYNSGDKESALAAVEDGLVTNPDSELLKSKKDVLTKDYFPSSNEVAPRQ